MHPSPVFTALVAALALCIPSASAGSDTRLLWIITGAHLERIAEQDPQLADYHFNRKRAYVIGDVFGQQNQAPSGYLTSPALKYKSYSRFRAHVSRRRIDPSIKAVIYDPENWAETPYREKKYPKIYLRRFAELARSHGYYVIASPGRDLVTVRNASCGRRSQESISNAFLRCNISGAAARYADVFKVQAQVHEKNPAQYRSFVERTRAQALAANPNVVFMSNLATSPSDYVATPEMLWAAYDAVDDIVAGHQLNINTPELAIAREFFRKVRSAGG